MRKTFKKVAASVMAVASLAVGMVGMSTNAATATDPYSKFTWGKSGSKASCALANTNKANRYAQVAIYLYDAQGNYITHVSNHGVIGDSESISTSTTQYAASYEYLGTLYLTTLPQGNPLSTWVRGS